MDFIQSGIHKSLFVILLVTGLLSCSRVTGPDVPENNIPLVFTTFADWGVKSNSLVNDSDDLQLYPISILANATANGDEDAAFKNDRLYYDGDEWKYDQIRYWIPGAKYSFAAFAPFASAGDYDGGNKLSNGSVSYSDDPAPVLEITEYNTIATDSRSEDLMVAHYVRDNSSSKDYSVVPLTFEHILSCVTFSIRNTMNEDVTKLSEIQLSGLKYKCNITLNPTSVSVVCSDDVDLSVASENRVSQDDGTPFLRKGMSEKEYKPLFDCGVLTLLPQRLYGNDIKLTFKIHRDASDNVGKSYSLNLGSVEALREWKAGKKYDYMMSITSKDVLFQVVEVPWIEDNVEL